MEVTLKTNVLKILVYFDLFDYPLTGDEIYRFLDLKTDRNTLMADLNQLTEEKYVFKNNDFYSLKNNPALIKKRITENDYAQPLLLRARKNSKFLFGFPYVKGIFISGSLSKNVAKKKSDIDYFVITDPNRLWIARTIMHLFKKLTFLTGHQHWYCMNYFIDEEGLQIEEKNIFTALELITLMPVRGNGAIDAFFKANSWSAKYFPNCVVNTRLHDEKPPGNRMRKLIERIFNSNAGNKLDNYLMKLTTRRWNLKEEKQKLTINGTRMGLRTGKHYCKPNPAFFQEKILTLYYSRLNEWKKRWDEKIQEIEPSFLRKEII
ncbi:MAG TPA: nucleotidyltransferase domain-containing protein [Puia sp.]|nr:nucleotidyltransferase domain-containing protein [Puia sp.]